MTSFGEVLIKARKFILSGETHYICTALTEAGGTRFRQRIMNQLDGRSTYESWLREKHPRIWGKMSHANIKAGRLQWIDFMIKQESLK